MEPVGRNVRSGFTMTELMVGIAIIGAMAVLSVPPVRAYRETLRVEAAAERLSMTVRSAQARARSRSHGMILAWTVDESTVVITDDADNDAVADDDEQSQTAEFDGVTISASTFAGDQLVFNSRGRAENGGTLTLTGKTSLSKELRVSAGTGQIKVSSPSE